MTEQVIRSLSLALKLQPHESLDGPGEQMSEGRWLDTEEGLLANWPEEVECPEALSASLSHVRRVRDKWLGALARSLRLWGGAAMELLGGQTTAPRAIPSAVVAWSNQANGSVGGGQRI